MVLHKQLRVLNRGTPCMIFNTEEQCVYNGKSDEILKRIVSLNNKYKNSFVKRIYLLTKPELALKIIVKCKEDNLNED